MNFDRKYGEFKWDSLNPQKLTTSEILILVIFIMFLLFPVPIPLPIAYWLDHALGIAVLLILAVYLFFSIHPLVCIVFLVVIYELVRRSSHSNSVIKLPMMDYTGSEKKRNRELKEMNPPPPVSLEEEIALTDFGKNYYTHLYNGVNDNVQPVFDHTHYAAAAADV